MDKVLPPTIPNVANTDIRETPSDQLGGNSAKSVTVLNPIVQGGFPDVVMFGQSTAPNTKK